jgi:hypothetical protein
MHPLLLVALTTGLLLGADSSESFAGLAKVKQGARRAKKRFGLRGHAKTGGVRDRVGRLRLRAAAKADYLRSKMTGRARRYKAGDRITQTSSQTDEGAKTNTFRTYRVGERGGLTLAKTTVRRTNLSGEFWSKTETFHLKNKKRHSSIGSAFVERYEGSGRSRRKVRTDYYGADSDGTVVRHDVIKGNQRHMWTSDGQVEIAHSTPDNSNWQPVETRQVSKKRATK